MKKIFLALLFLPTVVCTSDKGGKLADTSEVFYVNGENRTKQFQDPEYLKYSLGGNAERWKAALAYVAARRIHERLKNSLMSEKNDFKKAGESLVTSPDAVIVNTCATMEQNWRKKGDVGMISGNDHKSFIYLWGQKKFHGERFYKDGCDCSFYPKLTDEQLEQLRQGTQANLSKESAQVRPAQMHPSKNFIK